MAILLNVNANVRGQARIDRVNVSLRLIQRAAFSASQGINQLTTGFAAAGVAASRLSTRIVTLRTSFLTLLNPLALASASLIGIGGIFGAAVLFNAVRLGNDVERLRISFRAFFGDVQTGERAFNFIRDYASTVPFAFQEIQRGASNLAVTAAGDVDRFNELLGITGNVAAVAGISFEEAGLQIQRALSGGIGAADLLRDRGIRAVLGFQAGVMVSVEETVEAFDRVFGPGGRFGNITEELAKTVVGVTSLIGDRFDQVLIRLNDVLFPELFAQFTRFNEFLTSNGRSLDDFADVLARRVVVGLRALIRFGQFVYDNFQNILTVMQSIIFLRIGSFFLTIAANLVLVVRGAISAAIAFGQLGVVLVTQLIPAMGRFLIFSLRGLRRLVIGTVALAGALGGRLLRALKAITLFAVSSSARLLLNPIFALIAVSSAAILKVSGVFDRIKQGIIEVANTGEAYFDETSIGKFLNGEITTGDIVDAGLDAGKELAQGLTAGFTSEGFLETLEGVNASIRDLIFGDAFQIDGEDFINLDDPAAKAREELETIKQGIEEVNEVAQGLGAGFQNAFERATNVTENYTRVAENSVQSLGDEIANFALEGEFSFRRFANSVIQDIVRMEARALAARGLRALFNFGIGALSANSSGVGRAPTSFLELNRGGIVPGTGNVDSVPALLTPGELVVPKAEVGNYQNDGGGNYIFNYYGNDMQKFERDVVGIIGRQAGAVGASNRNYNQNTQGLKPRNG